MFGKMIFAVPLLLVGCAQEASHLPNPLLLPGQAVSNAAQNASYKARRARVAEHVRAHHPTLIAEIAADGGPHLQQAMHLARVPAQNRDALQRRLRQDLALYRTDPEALIVALMVHGA